MCPSTRLKWPRIFSLGKNRIYSLPKVLPPSKISRTQIINPSLWRGRRAESGARRYFGALTIHCYDYIKQAFSKLEPSTYGFITVTQPHKCEIQNWQDPVSTMQKTGLANHSSFLVWSGKGYHLYGCDHYGTVNNHFLLIRPFSAWCHPTEQTNNQPTRCP